MLLFAAYQNLTFDEIDKISVISIFEYIHDHDIVALFFIYEYTQHIHSRNIHNSRMVINNRTDLFVIMGSFA